jgi:hypothetical protein
LLDALKNELNVAKTLNGAKAFATTNSSLLDYFAAGGAMRERLNEDVIRLFSKAFAENPLLALKALFYFRDIRGGQGERKTFRTILRYMAIQDHTAEIMRKNMTLIPFFGRWDDLYEFHGTQLHKDAFQFMKETFFADLNSDKPTLLGKWLKSENATAKYTKKLGEATRVFFGLSERNYRKALSKLRHQIKIVERDMSAKEWGNIEYDRIPSKAGLVYKKAFMRNDEERYRAFLGAVEKGEAKINAGTLFPYEIVEKVLYKNDRDMALELMWKALPDYTEGRQENSMAIVDTSGSMSGRPMAVAISLGMYLAERNKGSFHNHFMTFSNTPELVAIKGNTIFEKVNNMSRSSWEQNTNIAAVFELLLNTAIKFNLTQEQMVHKVYIVSDMEFDAANVKVQGTGWNARKSIRSDAENTQLFREIESRYAFYDYKMPKLVFWNVDAKTEQYPEVNKQGVQLVSGCSPSLFKSLMKEEFVSPYELMLEVLNDERYNVVRV